MSDQQFYEDNEAEEILRLAARDASAGGMSRDRLIQTAAELGITPEAVERAERQVAAKKVADQIQSEEVELRKQFKQERRRGFMNDLASYAGSNLLMVGIWWMSGHGYFWPGWVLLAWGIGLISDFFSTFFSRDEEKKFRRWLRRRSRIQGMSEMVQRAEPILDNFFDKNDSDEKVAAMKELRDRLNIDARDAKDLVENYQAAERSKVIGVHIGRKPSDTKD